MLHTWELSNDYRIFGNDLFNEPIKNYEERYKDLFTDVKFAAVNWDRQISAKYILPIVHLGNGFRTFQLNMSLINRVG